MKLNYFKIAVCTALLCVLLPLSESQAQAKFGIRGGLNVSNISFDKLPDRGERFGFHTGIFADVPVLIDFIHLQPEFSYSVKGAAYKFLGERQTLNMKYVDFLLPVAFRLGIIDLQVGPFASYLISKPDYTVFDDTEVVTDAFKKMDYGLTAGFAVNFAPVFIGIRYNQGLVNITEDNAKVFLGDGKSAVGQVSLGVKF